MRTRLIVTVVSLGAALWSGCRQEELAPNAGPNNQALPAPSAPNPGEQPRPQVPADFLPPVGENGEYPIPPPAMAIAQKVFVSNCAQCHGLDGTGAGPAAKALTVRPRNWTLSSWQEMTTDDQIAKIIVEGGPALGLSAQMPAFPELKDEPDVVRGLVRIVRSYANPP